MVPDMDYEETAYQLAFLEFAWDIERALEFALFRTYAVPAISGLLARTGKFTTQTRKRYDDTELLLSEPLEHGLSSERGQQAIDRINAIHGRFKIANEDMLYVLSTFVLEPIRWMARFGRRAFTPDEIRAWTDYYRAVGHKMGITEIPKEFQAFEAMNLAYETEHFRYADSNRQIGDTTLDLLLGFYLPRSLVFLGRPLALSFMDPALLSAMGYAAPSPFVRQLVNSAMRIRSAVLRVMPRRKRPRLITKRKRPTYPGGYIIAELGSSPPQRVENRTCSSPIEG